MKTKTRLLLGLLVVLFLTASIVTVIYAASPLENACHKLCAEEYPQDFDLYKACMFGCLAGPNG